MAENHLKPFTLLGPRPGTCEECGVDHPPEYPHVKDRLFYQYKVFEQHGRWPSWIDAMAHCTDEMKDQWTKALTDRGVVLEKKGMVQICRVCGCTEDWCPACIKKLGHPCHWVEDDLCSACVDEGKEAEN